MRLPFLDIVEKARNLTPGPYQSRRGDPYGAFIFCSPVVRNHYLTVIANAGDPNATEEVARWDHVSVSLRDRCPTWAEMCWIKEVFFLDTECVVQYHPPKDDYVNCHQYCLHLWRRPGVEFPRPPSIAVGPKKLEK